APRAGRPGPASGPRRGRRRPWRRISSARRLNVALLAVAVAISLIVVRLVQLQGLEAAHYQTISQQGRLQRVPISAARGEITSANGNVLAMTVRTDQVTADPPLIAQTMTLAQAAGKLARPLGMASTAVLWLLRHPSSPQYVVLKNAVGASEADYISSLGIYGITLTPSYTRVYPGGDLAAGLLGFTDTRNGVLTGQAGVEQSYNSLLAGRSGTEVYQAGLDGQPIPGTQTVVRRAVPADNLRLTIQSSIQWYAERACAAQIRKTGAQNCSVVVMRPDGQILALAQYPTFNPAAPASLTATTDIPVSNIFTPGSTAKVITAAAAFEHGGQTPLSSYVVPDALTWHGYTYHDAEFHPALHYTIAGIIANSLNDGMVQVAQHITPAEQYSMYRAFGIGSAPRLNLPNNPAGLLPPPSKWTGGYRNERYMLSFGQGVGVTAVQMASVYATIANGGVRVAPTIVAGHTTSSGTYVPASPPPGHRIIWRKTAAQLMACLEQVPLAYANAGEYWGLIPGYTVAAKTGTSQEPGPIFGSSFIGIAPASSNGLIVAVNVQAPRGQNYFGIGVAGPVFNAVMKFALATMKIPPDGGRVKRLPLTVP
ncbi:MAG: peptidoglycan D,D-transpeptidase FtsI family protein, partial [Streptosporangiaceae bacterium]